MLTCETCSRGAEAINASGHDCAECKHMTYSQMAICEPCGLVLDQCVICRGTLNLALDAAIVQKVTDLVTDRNSKLAAIKAEQDATLAPIAAEIARYREGCNALGVAMQALYDKHYHVVHNRGGSSLLPKTPEDEAIVAALRKEQQSVGAKLNEEFAAFQPLHDYANRKASIESGYVERVFDLQLNVLVQAAMMPMAMRFELQRLEQDYQRNRAALVDPRAAATDSASPAQAS